jgi:hypothetical protein
LPITEPEGASIICHLATPTTGRVEWDMEIKRVQSARVRGQRMDAIIWAIKNNDKDSSLRPAAPRGVDQMWKDAQEGDPPMRIYTQHYHFEPGIYSPASWKFNMDQINAFANDIVALNK